LNPFINGVSFWENSHLVFSPGLGVDYIESMCVMTGGFSAEYGNRFGGALDVVTKSGFTMNNNGSITLGLGTALRHNAGIEFGGHTDRAAYYLNFSGFESARFLSPPEPHSIHNTGRGSRGFAQFEFSVNQNNFLKLVFMGDGTNFQLPKTDRDELLRPNFNNFQRTRSQSSMLIRRSLQCRLPDIQNERPSTTPREPIHHDSNRSLRRSTSKRWPLPFPAQ
jgi:hypothetical protein